MAASNWEPFGLSIWYEPSIAPRGVSRTHPLVYSKCSPGRRVGCSPTTPGPRTCSTLPLPSVMIQCRLFSCAVSVPSLLMRTVYAKTYRFDWGDDCPGTYSQETLTLMPSVIASDTG